MSGAELSWPPFHSGCWWRVVHGGVCRWGLAGEGSRKEDEAGERINTPETSGRILCEQAPTGLDSLGSEAVLQKSDLMYLEMNRA